MDRKRPQKGNRAGASPPESAPPDPSPRASFFGSSDWRSAAIAGVLVFLVYCHTMAPDVTLEDSGELAVAADYAGVPHPPGYPVWTLYSWLFTVLVPFSNIAWRVTLGSAFAGACSCALLALMVSRGTRAMLQGMGEDFGSLDPRDRTRISTFSGVVSGMLMGFNGFMWSQAVIVEVYTLSVLSLMGTLACLMRWMYRPGQRGYLYLTFFLFGICFNNHQSLVVAAIGLEIAIAMADRALGRDLFLGNVAVYVLGLVGKMQGWVAMFDENLPMFIIYNLVGLGSICAFAWLWTLTPQRPILGEGRWRTSLILLLVWTLGLSFYLYLPIASSTNPPMNWGYPRTWEGFLHTFFRQQYEQPNPTIELTTLIQQMWMYLIGAAREFNPLLICVAFLPFLFLNRMERRERAWLTGLAGVFFCLAVVLMILLNPKPDRQSQELNRVFFTPSHTVIAIWMGHGLGLVSAFLAARFRQARPYAIFGGIAALGASALLALDPLDGYGWEDRRVHPLDISYALLLVFCAGAFVAVVAGFRHRAPLPVVLSILFLLPVQSLLAHWWVNEKRGHLFGYWFGRDMFEPPFGLYPSMDQGAILYGGTDPGRFNPTYMIFSESFLPPSKKRDPGFDRRDVYLITQNAMADPRYLDYIRAHYSRSSQEDPPFFQEMLRTDRSRRSGRTNFLARMAAPLDQAMAGFGARVEARRRKNGLYPQEEILVPSQADFEKAVTQYMVENRSDQLGRDAVQFVNSALTRKIFDSNPDREFYIEESFVLDWMFPYLSPYGIILRLNREPVPVITSGMMARDRDFWDRYMERLIGDSIGPESSIGELVEYSVGVHLRGDLEDYRGDPRFLRNDWAKKAFSKLRCAIAGVYAWRVSPMCPPELAPGAENRRDLIAEADYAFRQAVALCPYSVETLYRYSIFLNETGRTDDAIELAKMCSRFDPENGSIRMILEKLKKEQENRARILQLDKLEEQFAQNPARLEVAETLAVAHLARQDTNRVLDILRFLAGQEDPGPGAEDFLIHWYNKLGRYQELEEYLLEIVQSSPDRSRAWFILGTVQAQMGKNSDAIGNLARAVEMAREDEQASRLFKEHLRQDPRFNQIRFLPGFQELIQSP